MRKAHILPAIVFLVGACRPQSAVLTSGSYVAFVPDTSATLDQERIDLEGFSDYFQLDCRPFEDKKTAEALRLPDRLQLCGALDDGGEDFFAVDTDEYGIDNPLYGPMPDLDDFDDDQDGVYDVFDCNDTNANVGACDDGGDGFWPPSGELWVKYNGWHVVTEDLDPWRGSAVVTHEGDLQVAFHHRMPGGADFAFQFSLDRFFQPVVCAYDYETEEVKRTAYDGDWIGGWSEDLQAIADLRDDEEAFAPFAHMDAYLDDGRLWYFNARGYQFNPEQNDDQWFMPQRWAAASAYGTFGEELMVDRQDWSADAIWYDTLEGLYEGVLVGNSIPADAYLEYIWNCPLDPGGDLDNDFCQTTTNRVFTFQDVADRAHAEADRGKAELDHLFRKGDPDADPIYSYSSLVHENRWRTVDGTTQGFDGWAQRFGSYVVFSGDSDLRVGGSARGAFTLLLQGQDSGTRTFLRGEFEIPKIKQDTWAPYDLQEQKREESGIEYCGY